MRKAWEGRRSHVTKMKRQLLRGGGIQEKGRRGGRKWGKETINPDFV